MQDKHQVETNDDERHQERAFRRQSSYAFTRKFIGLPSTPKPSSSSSSSSSSSTSSSSLSTVVESTSDYDTAGSSTDADDDIRDVESVDRTDNSSLTDDDDSEDVNRGSIHDRRLSHDRPKLLTTRASFREQKQQKQKQKQSPYDHDHEDEKEENKQITIKEQEQSPIVEASSSQIVCPFLADPSSSSSSSSTTTFQTILPSTSSLTRYLSEYDVVSSSLTAWSRPLSTSEVVHVQEAWNKLLAFKDMAMEAFSVRWRISADDTMEKRLGALSGTTLTKLIFGIIDAAVRGISPDTQKIFRESFRAEHEQSRDEYATTLAGMGLRPQDWYNAVIVWHWTLQTHTPYFEQVEHDDLALDFEDCALVRFFTLEVAMPCINAGRELRARYCAPVYGALLHVWRNMCGTTDADKCKLGEAFYRSLFANHPILFDFFKSADFDLLGRHLIDAIDVVMQNTHIFGDTDAPLFDALNNLAVVHLRNLIPSWAYNLVASYFISLLVTGPLAHFSQASLTEAAVHAFTYVGKILAAPMLIEEELYGKAEHFINLCADELQWSAHRRSARLFEIKASLASTRTYIHSTEELTHGARVAWRNSGKCIGRISWNTLVVRDRRYINLRQPQDILAEIIEHLKVATGGTNLTSVMTVFRPRQPNERDGPRFWTPQFVRFAGYAGLGKDGGVLGDPANESFTSFLIDAGLWSMPATPTAFDVLPVVMKVPECSKPHVFTLPSDSVHMCSITHPTIQAISELGYKWATVPAITNFNMAIGGIDYVCCPFNGWFMELEVVRNLYDRYDAKNAVADVMGLDKSQKLWENKVWHELSVAVLHSFERSRFTMVDQHTAGASFFTHCMRERSQGRECPGQWSWIGGLVGPINSVWHHEMRDFVKEPSYRYQMEHWLTTLASDPRKLGKHKKDVSSSQAGSSESALTRAKPSVLILFGSETGTAERIARRLARNLVLLRPTTAPLNSFASDDARSAFVKHTHIVVVTSTFGRGEPPSNATLFAASHLKEGVMKGVKYAVLALGSTIYPDYCKFGVNVAHSLEHSGGVPFLSLTRVDEAKGIDAPANEWLSLCTNQLLPPALEAALKIEKERRRKLKKKADAPSASASSPASASSSSSSSPSSAASISSDSTSASTSDSDGCEWVPPTSSVQWETTSRPETEEEEEMTNRSSAFMKCVSNEELFENGDIKRRSTRLLTFEPLKGTADEKTSLYTTGDHLSVIPLNSWSVVRSFLSYLGLETRASSVVAGVTIHDNGDDYPASVSLPLPCRLSHLCRRYIDFRLSRASINEWITLLSKHQEQGFDRNNSRIAEWAFSLTSPSSSTSSTSLATIKSAASSSSSSSSSTTSEDVIDTVLSVCPTLIDLFKLASSEGISTRSLPFSSILPLLSRTPPRYYSISSSSLERPHSPQIAVSVVHTTTAAGVEIDGICSNYLAALSEGDCAMVAVKESSFRAPNDIINANTIMVGAGTGIAPMMGFIVDQDIALKKLQAASSSPSSSSAAAAAAAAASINESSSNSAASRHVFFGSRSASESIFSSSLRSFENSGTITRLHIAHSRSQPAPASASDNGSAVQRLKYVQDCLTAFGEQLCKLLLHPSTHYYVCGDAVMADAAFEACVNALRKYGGMSRVFAVQHISIMRAQNRWQMDVWGVVSKFDESREKIRQLKAQAAVCWLSKFKSDE